MWKAFCTETVDQLAPSIYFLSSVTLKLTFKCMEYIIQVLKWSDIKTICLIPSPPTNQIAMSSTINRSFARVSVRSLTSKHSSRKHISGGRFSRVLEYFNKQFRGYSSFEIDEATAKTWFPIVNKAFNCRLHPADARNQYETAFPPQCMECSSWCWKASAPAARLWGL